MMLKSTKEKQTILTGKYIRNGWFNISGTFAREDFARSSQFQILIL